MKKLVTLCAFSILGIAAFAHKGHNGRELGRVAKDSDLKKVSALYERDVKRIFQRSCFDCHSQNMNFPWYYVFPGASHLINSDIQEAREHLDLTQGFPFKGHGSPQEDLEAIEGVVKDNSMPPFRYWVLHRGTKLPKEEKEIILNWISESKKLLNAP